MIVGSGFSIRWSHILPGFHGTRTSMFIAHAQDVKGGAGQYFTPCPLIPAMVEVMQPAVQGWTNVAGDRTPRATNSGFVVAGPACGTGGFLLAAHDYMAGQATSKKEQRHLKEHALHGNDIVDSVVHLCTMSLFLHGISATGGQAECPITANDTLAKEVGDDKVDMVLANPPFGKKSYNKNVAVRLFMELWRTQYTFECGYSLKGVKI